MDDIYGWIGTGIMALGSFDVAHKRVRGLWLMFIGNLFWAFVGYRSGLSSLIGVSILMGALDLYGVRKWSIKTEAQKNREEVAYMMTRKIDKPKK